MSDSITRVRSFNRTFASALGAMDASFLGRGRPLGEARLIWEIGPSGAEIRELRQRLALDSGYATRLLRSLERQGLVIRAPSPSDARVRSVRLTSAGEREREELDRLSDAFASSLLDPLPSAERDRLVAAMATVERLVTRAQMIIAEEKPTNADVRWCFTQYFGELDRRFEGGFDVRRSIRADPADLTPPAGLVLVARVRGTPVACGALRIHADGVTELKRMWVAPHVRGLGVGRQMLAELERHAAMAGARRIHLETNDALPEAIAMYRGSGYVEVPAFNDDPYADHWFEKRLAAPSRKTAVSRARVPGRP